MLSEDLPDPVKHATKGGRTGRKSPCVCVRAAHVSERNTEADGGEVAAQITTVRGARGTAVVNPDGSFSLRMKVREIECAGSVQQLHGFHRVRYGAACSGRLPLPCGLPSCGASGIQPCLACNRSRRHRAGAGRADGGRRSPPRCASMPCWACIAHNSRVAAHLKLSPEARSSSGICWTHRRLLADGF